MRWGISASPSASAPTAGTFDNGSRTRAGARDNSLGQVGGGSAEKIDPLVRIARMPDALEFVARLFVVIIKRRPSPRGEGR